MFIEVEGVLEERFSPWFIVVELWLLLFPALFPDRQVFPGRIQREVILLYLVRLFGFRLSFQLFTADESDFVHDYHFIPA